MKQLTTLFIAFLILNACSSRLHPLEEPAIVHVPHIVKAEDLTLRALEPIYDNDPEIPEIPDDPSKYYIY